LHRRASAWFERNGLLDAAMSHALRAGDSAVAEQLVLRHRVRLMNEDGWQRLERWLCVLPRSAVDASPELLVTEAALAHIQFRKTDSLRVLERAESLLAAQPDLPARTALRGEIAGLRTDVLGDQADFSARAESAAVALRTAPHDRWLARSLAWLHSSLARLIHGERMGAFEWMYGSLSVERDEGDGCKAHLLTMASFLHVYAGDLPGLRRAANEVLRISGGADGAMSRNWARHHVGVLSYGCNDLTTAEAVLSRVVAERHHAGAHCAVQSAFALALTYQAQGRPQLARETADLAGRHALDRGCRSLLSVVAAFQARLALQQGRVAEAVERVSDAVIPAEFGFAPFFFNPHVAVIRIWLASDMAEHHSRAALALGRLRAHAEAMRNTSLLIQTLALEAVQAGGCGDRVAALNALERALVLAQPGDDVRTFADLGPAITDLLPQLHGLRVDAGYVRRIRCAAAASRQVLGAFGSAECGEVLSPRELQVLSLLQRQLSDKEIAAELVIAPGTVKSHTRSIFEKLHVNRRKAAVMRAVDLGLLVEPQTGAN
jgi:LuxR family maltose regulon positive regulatory protein